MPADLRQPVALTIAGSDSSSGAGIQADLKTFTTIGVYGATVITALTAQNTRGVSAVSAVSPDVVAAQITSVFSDLKIVTIKTGMLANAAIATRVADALDASAHIALIVDPVMVATSGDSLLTDDAVEIYRKRLNRRATLLTPNQPEAARLLGEPAALTLEDAIRQAKALHAFGSPAVLLKGGHAPSDITGTSEIVDVLCDHGEIVLYKHQRIATNNTHGTGCTLSAAITAYLTLGLPLREAIQNAIIYLEKALISSARLVIGSGHGPVDHLFAIRASVT
jgi:hydroxymethylpyrimidine/phosphomethylpyrimidine kinase